MLSTGRAEEIGQNKTRDICSLNPNCGVLTHSWFVDGWSIHERLTKLDTLSLLVSNNTAWMAVNFGLARES